MNAFKLQWQGYPSRDLLFVAGDWNARTGPCDATMRLIIGKYGLGQRCNNGERLVTSVDYNHFDVTGNGFQHPHWQLLMWYSNDGQTANHIDYIFVRSRWAISVPDSRSFRGAGVGSDSELAHARCKLRLSSQSKRLPTKRVNVMALSNTETRVAFNESLTAQILDQSTVFIEPPDNVDNPNSPELATTGSTEEGLGLHNDPQSLG
ncbi:unnamed protein product [Dibothriocephalus latus]|uniref:Endonuclease/exonuclease/phosphatase domain-containing protein n=1 Tax=Dibothriocephalus latus TaxID=60516 RepID=A0A3P6R1S0_DIBLA|nr:unnamed protein product [Dibothriocephalus latus]